MNSQDWEAVRTSGEPQGGYNLVFGSNFLHMIPLSVLAVFSPLSGYLTPVGEEHNAELMQEKKYVHIQPRRTAPDLFRLALAQARRFRHFDPPDPVRTVPTFHDRVLFPLGRKGEPHLRYDALVLRRRLPLAWLTSARRKNSLTTRSARALCPNRKLLIVLACARSTNCSASPRNAAGSSKRSTRSKRTATGSSCFNLAGRKDPEFFPLCLPSCLYQYVTYRVSEICMTGSFGFKRVESPRVRRRFRSGLGLTRQSPMAGVREPVLALR
jgi:hypothetical protein